MVTRSTANTWYDGNYAWMDGVETVTYTPVALGGSAVASARARRTEVDRTDFALGIVGLSSDDVVFTLWASTISDASVGSSDTITDEAGDVWTILSARRVRFDTQWRCVCRKQVS